ncbi:MAG: twin-arginine translocation signal domain-containing protein [Alphaproteobacteria bacterium]|nr:twin-arginine translocation signal domain-containing protein [Alphaproteobacteria bacterium]
MGRIDRRGFLKLAGATTLAGAVGAPYVARAQAAPKVVIVGGGFGGASAAKALRRWAPSIQVTLVEAKRSFVTCPYSNLVLAGWRTMEQITFGYDGLAKAGVTMAHDTATAIDAAGKTVSLAGGQSLAYDRLIVSPGIDIKWGAISGYDEAAAQKMPHAWLPGEQTVLLRKQLEAMPDGGVVMMAIPANPFRCPPGPYERISMIAAYLKQAKPKSKLIALDAKDAFSKKPLFEDGWKKLYGDMVEWVALSKDGQVSKVDPAAMTLETQLGTVHKAAVANVICPHYAGRIARDGGLADGSGWCPIDARTFESKLIKDIHVIGDATIAAPAPKSGFVANSMGKVAAAAAIDMLAGREPSAKTWVNTCYSHIAKDYAISVAGVFSADANGAVVEIKDSGGVSPREAADEFRRQEAIYADSWYDSITKDTWA